MGTVGTEISKDNRGNKINSFDFNDKTRDAKRQKASKIIEKLRREN